ncbi:MAG: pilus assembly/Cpx signaling pathway, periplasmic inhibitor/zinc-resistance associated protein [Candidatus Angelobacter sp.]|nr:pilus assembly/Cpx signaling pathway, periplasmic inhibitor/zinc-resistance associated protein [Candidatus Angelobacter sp.]
MNRKFILIAALLLALAASLATTAFGQHRNVGFGRHDGWMLKHMARQLNLTETQKTQIKSIMAEEKTKIKPMLQQLRQNEQAENANVNGSFDENQARAFANKQAQLMTDLIVEKERTRSQVYAMLTPEQRQKALQLMQERQQHRQERMSMKKQAEQKQQSK